MARECVGDDEDSSTCKFHVVLRVKKGKERIWKREGKGETVSGNDSGGWR